MDFSFKYYLPDSKKRIDHLRRIVDGRPVAILAAGPSIGKLERRIGELRNADICYFGMNLFLQETHILKRIDRHLSLFMNASSMHLVIKDVINFLNRDEDNMHVCTLWRNAIAFKLMNNDFDLNHFLCTYDKKLIFFYLSYSRSAPNEKYPLHFISGNTLQTVIQLAIIGKASKIVLFGADGGYKENSQDHYYLQDIYEPLRPSEPIEDLNLDTREGFNPIMPIAIRNTCQTYKIAPIDILNCSEDSFYTPFPKVSYDDTFEYLLTNKKFNRKSDLRVPKVSVITPVVDKRDYLKETIESVSNQSYSNHEHIIVYDEASDEIRDMMQKFPHVRWLAGRGCNHLQAFRKGVLEAKGEYICYCPFGDSYANPDWLNTCVGLMENRADISLVWGLCQHMSESGVPGRIINVQLMDNPPPQEKEFIYYWLKKRTPFPEGNLCVRKRVLEECFPSDEVIDEREAWLTFHYNFNTLGYLPLFVPVVANYHRTYRDKNELYRLEDSHNLPPFYFLFLTADSVAEGQEAIGDEVWHKALDTYYGNIGQYRKSLAGGKIVHRYRKGNGEILPDYINRSLFLSYELRKYAEKKLPDKWLQTCKDIRFVWRKYHWRVFRVAIVKLLGRLRKKPEAGE